MNNPFRISREGLIALLVDSTRRFSAESYGRLLETFTREEIREQLDGGAGAIFDVIREHNATFAAETSNVEVVVALGLSDFYFPHSETEIAFELARRVNPATVTTYESLVESFENNTPVDCQITGDGTVLSFQIKRYPLERLGDTNQDFLNWFRGVIEHYGNMRGTILAILMQPSGAPVQVPFNPALLHDEMLAMRDQITFDEVVLQYNDHGEHFALHKIFPEHRRLLVPMDWGLRRFRGDV